MVRLPRPQSGPASSKSLSSHILFAPSVDLGAAKSLSEVFSQRKQDFLVARLQSELALAAVRAQRPLREAQD